MSWVILPCKDFVRAKTRLSGLLAPHERRALMQAMVEDVLTVVAGHPDIAGGVLVSDDPAAALLAANYGLSHLDERELAVSGLNAAVSAAAAMLAAQGVNEVLVLHGDVPAVASAEIDQLLAATRSRGQRMVLVGDRCASGTNGLWYRGAPPRFCYGEDSLEQHRSQVAGTPVLALHGLGLDVDDPADLAALISYLEIRPALAPRTRQVLETEGLAARVRAVMDTVVPEGTDSAGVSS